MDKKKLILLLAALVIAVGTAFAAATNPALSIDLGTGGSHEATMWTCDFSAEYVRINAEYRT